MGFLDLLEIINNLRQYLHRQTLSNVYMISGIIMAAFAYFCIDASTMDFSERLAVLAALLFVWIGFIIWANPQGEEERGKLMTPSPYEEDMKKRKEQEKQQK